MERWRSFFGSSGEDLWTIIDRAITIAAIDYPQELRVRRDGFAEKLFAPAIHSLASSVGDRPALPVTDHRADKLSAPNLLPLSSSIGEAPAATGSDAQTGACSHIDKEDRHEREARGVDYLYKDDANLLATPGCHESDALRAEREVFGQVREISIIKGRIMDLDQTEECILISLKRLEDMRISVPSLKTTGIGKPVNALRKHASRKVRLIAKRLVSSWKDVVDDWVKKQGEDAAVAYVDSRNIVADDNENLFFCPHTNDGVFTAAQSRSAKMSQMLDIKCDDLSAGSALFYGIDQQVLHSKLECDGMNTCSDNQSQYLLPDSNTHSRAHNDMELDVNCQARINPRVEADADIVTEEKLKTISASCKLAVNPKETEVAHRTVTHKRVYFSATAITKQKLLSSKPGSEMKPKCPESASGMQRFEAAKRKLHEGYQQAEYAKKQRIVQVLDVENLPKVGQGQGKGVSGPLRGKSGSTK